IEQDADIVMFLFREDYYEKETTNKNHVNISIAKNRSGTIGEFNLLFNKNMSTFSNLSTSNYDESLSKEQSKDDF
ncbi:MAG TPA: DnaB-like helicase C-terminal domain-containing protein, partial [Candidatus Izemoplasmatales bacterium]|nr:DnaB-like helicase C-terminal domain-containing protein [Candidatus Izemoplasmatales bacterium]